MFSKLFGSYFLILLLSNFFTGIFAESPQGYYRLEVLFTHFNNEEGKIFNGKNCDVMSACDPMIFAFIDIDDPVAPFPGRAKSLHDFQKLVSESGKNVLIMNSKLTKDICKPIFLHRQKPVNVRAVANDHDYFTQYDLIDEFDCRFTFIPKPGSFIDRPDDSAWSPVQSCKATNRPDKVNLSYRWRAYPIMASDCGYKLV